MRKTGGISSNKKSRCIAFWKLHNLHRLLSLLRVGTSQKLFGLTLQENAKVSDLTFGPARYIILLKSNAVLMWVRYIKMQFYHIVLLCYCLCLNLLRIKPWKCFYQCAFTLFLSCPCWTCITLDNSPCIWYDVNIHVMFGFSLFIFHFSIFHLKSLFIYYCSKMISWYLICSSLCDACIPDDMVPSTIC